MINNLEKIEIIQNKINTMSFHVIALREDIINSPLGDIPEKPSRQSVLYDILSIINTLEAEKEALTNQG
jgi:hypothetical protein